MYYFIDSNYTERYQTLLFTGYLSTDLNSILTRNGSLRVEFLGQEGTSYLVVITVRYFSKVTELFTSLLGTSMFQPIDLIIQRNVN